jgi:hypothetical protein
LILLFSMLRVDGLGDLPIYETISISMDMGLQPWSSVGDESQARFVEAIEFSRGQNPGIGGPQPTACRRVCDVRTPPNDGHEGGRRVAPAL